MDAKNLTLPKVKFYREKKYPGVFYLLSAAHTRDGTQEKVFYARYRTRDRVQHFERIGSQVGDKMTAAKASEIRALRAAGAEPTNRGLRAERDAAVEAAQAAQEEARLVEVSRWPISRLWDDYKAKRYDDNPPGTEKTNYARYLESAFGTRTPDEITTPEVTEFMSALKKSGKRPGTVVKITELLRRLINFGAGQEYYDPPRVHVLLPTVKLDREPEFLKVDELKRLHDVLDAYPDKDVAAVVRLALLTGMRRSELFRLEWKHLDLERGFLRIAQSKGGEPATIPMQDEAWAMLYDRARFQKHQHPKLIFPGRGGKVRNDVNRHARAIRTAANLPDSFRLFHGSRHHFASERVSAGAPLYVVGALLTHKSLQMTQRYSHLSDVALRNAANLVAPGDTGKRKELGA